MSKSKQLYLRFVDANVHKALPSRRATRALSQPRDATSRRPVRLPSSSSGRTRYSNAAAITSTGSISTAPRRRA